MASASEYLPRTALHPAHAFFLAATVPPFLGAAVSDYVYTKSFEVQWSNFADWLIVGGLVFGGAALVFAFAAILPLDRRRLPPLEFVLLLAMWVLGFINAFVHAGDAWATMPAGLVLSVVVLVLACTAAWLGFARRGVRP